MPMYPQGTRGYANARQLTMVLPAVHRPGRKSGGWRRAHWARKRRNSIDTNHIDAIPDEKMFGAFEVGLTLLHVEPDGTLAELSERDADTLLVICDQVAKRTRDAETVRGMLRCAPR